MDNQPIISNKEPNKSNKLSKILIFVLIVLGFISAFAGGYFLDNLLKKELVPPIEEVRNTPSPIPSASISASSVPNTPKIQNEPDGFQETNNFIAYSKPQ